MSNSKYNQEVADVICTRISEGLTLRQICKELNISTMSIHRWLVDNHDFEEAYSKARRAQVAHMVDEIIEIADTPTCIHKVKVKNEDGSESIVDVEMRSNEHNNDRRIRIDARKWYISKVVPKLPIPKGTIDEQITQINQALAKGDINENIAEILLRMVTARFQCFDASEACRLIKEQTAKLDKHTEQLRAAHIK